MKQIRSVPKKYTAARFTAWVTQAVGYIVTVAGPVIAVLGTTGLAIAGKPIPIEALGSFFFLVVLTPIIGIPIIAQGQLMSIAIEVEHNTRAMVREIRKVS